MATVLNSACRTPQDCLMTISNKEFKLISSLIYEKFAIHLTEQKRSTLICRLQKHLRTYGFYNFKDYYDYILSDSSKKAFSDLIDRICTNYTFFYREKEHFNFLLQKGLPEIINSLKKRNEKDIRIWCAGCSTGE